jgi:hypothetical protein
VIVLKHKTRSTEQGLKRSKTVVTKTNSTFSSNSHSGGANNVMSYGAIEMMVCRLDEARKFTRDSVFVDLQCYVRGSTVHVIGCACYGVEKESEPLKLPHKSAQTFGLAKLCTLARFHCTTIPRPARVVESN